jgi:hypothetical protein
MRPLLHRPEFELLLRRAPLQHLLLEPEFKPVLRSFPSLPPNPAFASHAIFLLARRLILSVVVVAAAAARRKPGFRYLLKQPRFASLLGEPDFEVRAAALAARAGVSWIFG